jgi:hypothetical protein
MRKMKAQAAMEYLMTYGWAILIIIVVVAALYAMGILRIPTGVAPCSPCFPPGSDLVYVDHSRDSVILRVGPRDIRDVNITSPVNVPAGGTYPNGPFSSGTDLTFTSTGAFAGDVTIRVTYTVVGGTTHTLTATLHGA